MRPLILFILCASQIFAENHSNHRVNLDDIERDNLLSEKLAKRTKGEDVFDIHQSQNFHTKNLEYYRQQLKALKELQEQHQSTTTSRPYQVTHETSTASGGISHVISTTTPSYHAYKLFASPNLNVNHYSTPVYQRPQHDHVEYVTIAPKPKYQYQRDDDNAKVSSYLPPHQYVYVQSNRVQPKAIQYNQQRQANDVQYATSSAPGSGLGQVESVIYSHDDDGDQQEVEQQQIEKDQTAEAEQQQEQQPYQQAFGEGSNQPIESNLQYVRYIGQGPTPHQSYVTMVAIPATYGHTQPIRFTPSVITYSHSSPVAVTPVVGGQRQTIQYLPQTLSTQATGQLQYVNTNDISEPSSSAIQYLSQLQDIQYADPEQSSSRPADPDGSKQFKYAPKHPERPLLQVNQEETDRERSQLLTKVQYLTAQRVVPLHQTFHQYVPQAQINVQPLHQFQPYREPKSLIESYVPSWIVIQRQQKQQYMLRQRSLGHQQIGGPSPQHNRYNTIAYSAPQDPSLNPSENWQMQRIVS